MTAWTLPDFCHECGVLLQGGATRHKVECFWYPLSYIGIVDAHEMSKPTPDILAQADADLAAAYREYTLEELRWDWGCRIRDDSRKILLAELERRGVDFKAFVAMGRGRRREA